MFGGGFASTSSRSAHTRLARPIPPPPAPLPLQKPNPQLLDPARALVPNVAIFDGVTSESAPGGGRRRARCDATQSGEWVRPHSTICAPVSSCGSDLIAEMVVSRKGGNGWIAIALTPICVRRPPHVTSAPLSFHASSPRRRGTPRGPYVWVLEARQALLCVRHYTRSATYLHHR